MIIFGIGGLLNDPACAILRDGRLAAAVEQKKVARVHLPGELPAEAIQACLEIAGLSAANVDCLAVVRPLASGVETENHLKLRALFPKAKVVLVEHHVAHAASAFFASPFDRARVLTLDRSGDFRCGVRWEAAGNQLTTERELYYPDSLGELYGRVTQLLGGRQRADEHKLQWLSTTTTDARFKATFLEILSFDGEDWPTLDRSFFDANHLAGGGFSAKFFTRLGLTPGDLHQESVRAAIAASLQGAVEEAVLRMAGKGENLCLAGGLFSNALLVAALENSGNWKNVFVQPAAGNAGTAIGAVLFAWRRFYRRSEPVSFETLCLGPSYGPEEIKQVLENCKLRFRYLLTREELTQTAVALLQQHRIVAWMHGRMEFGPRALGNRSILASPLDPYSTENLNVYIKRREPYRKFAASVPAELASRYFEVGPNARFLATVGRVRPEHRKTFESAVMSGGRIRVHTVEERENPLYHQLLMAAGRATGLPVLYNTSFNLFADPLVCTPRDAVRSFYSSGIDAMFIGNFLLEK